MSGRGDCSRTALALGLCVVAAHGHAAGEMVLALDEQDYFAELPVVLTASRLPQQVADAPAAVTIIDRQMIEAAGVADIPSLFRLVAGFQVAHDRDQRVSVTYHGASDQFARRMQVLVDGRSIYTPITGGVEWVDLPVSLQDIARIEVTRGPNGVAYGANSFLGVINIITFHPNEVQGYSAKATLGDDGYRKGTMRYAGNSGDLDYRITLEQREDSGFRDVDGGNQDALDSQRTTALALRGDYRASINDYLSFQLGQSDGPRQRGYVDRINDPARWQQSAGNFQQLSWKRIHSTSEEFRVQFYRNYQRHSDSYVVDLGLPLLAEANQDIETERFNLEFEHRFAPLDDWRFVWGGEARLDRVQAPGFLGTPDTFDHTLYRLFANAEWRFAERWIANLGALVEYNELNHAQTSPRLALNYRLNGGRYLRASYTEAWRTPSLFEEKADYAAWLTDGTVLDQLYVSDGGLDAEHMSSYEFAFGGISEKYRASYEVKLFREELRDLIAVYDDEVNPADGLLQTGVYRFTNDGETTIKGFEVQARLQPTERSLISVAYSHTRAVGHLLEYVSATEEPYLDMRESTPRDTASLLLGHTLAGGWGGSLGVYYVSEMEWLSGNPTHYTTADFTLHKRLRGPLAEGAVFFAVRDFLGTYFDHADNIYQERRAYFGIELRVR